MAQMRLFMALPHEAAPTAARRSISSRHDRVFYTGMSVAAIATVFIGFARTYYLRPYFHLTPLAPVLHVHGLVFTGWVLLFATQVALVARHRIDLHRRLGVAGAVLAALLVAVGATTAVAAARRNFAAGGPGGHDALEFLAVPLGDMIVFLILAAAAIFYRRRAETHKRLMLLATVSILDAAISRWPLAIISAGPVAFFGITDLFVAAGPVYDVVSRRRVHPAYLWGGLLIVASQPLRLAVARSDAWLAIARALIA